MSYPKPKPTSGSLRWHRCISGLSPPAIRYEDFKIHIKASQGGLPGMDFYNIKRDPGEKFGALYPGLYAVTPVQMIMRQHMGMIERFPHRPPEVPGSAELTPHD